MTPLPDAIQDFVDRLQSSLLDASLGQAVLAKYHGDEAGLQRVNLRRVRLRDQPHLQVVQRYATRDITHNIDLAQSAAAVRGLLGVSGFRKGHLHTTGGTAELTITQRGQAHVRWQPAASAEPPIKTLAQAAADAPAAADDAHNRRKHRMIEMNRPFLVELGVTTAQHRLIPSMARKWKQINKFLEVFAGALASSRLATAPSLQVADFGSGKGYLTFAVHDWLRHARHVDAQVTGVELRPDMVALCNAAIDRLQLTGLRIEQGDVRQWAARALNVVIALHACDTATDHAIHLGVRSGADIILCAPCCHQQLRPQLLSPHPIRAILQHGIHLGQEAEMLTDGLRALLLEAAGYDTQVFEFVSLEHTAKNKMILAVRRAQAKSPDVALAQIAEVKAFYGIRSHCLESLLAGDAVSADLSAAASPGKAVADNPA